MAMVTAARSVDHYELPPTEEIVDRLLDEGDKTACPAAARQSLLREVDGMASQLQHHVSRFMGIKKRLTAIETEIDRNLS